MAHLAQHGRWLLLFLAGLAARANYPPAWVVNVSPRSVHLKGDLGERRCFVGIWTQGREAKYALGSKVDLKLASLSAVKLYPYGDQPYRFKLADDQGRELMDYLRAYTGKEILVPAQIDLTGKQVRFADTP